LGLKSGDLFLDGAEMGVAAVVSLDVGMDSPILALLKLFNDEGVCIGVGLDMGKEPSREGFGDVIAVNAGGGVQILDEYGVIGSSGCAHDSTLVDVLDVAGLHGESVHDDGKVGYLPAVLFESLGTFDCISLFVGAEATLKVLNRGSTTGSDGFKVGAMLGFLRCESLRKSTIPSCLGLGQGLVDAVLNIVSLLSEGGDKVLVSIFAVDGAL
jgi:hypothetical protein